MVVKKETWGKVLFATLIIIFLACAIFAYTKTGPMDIESRFMNAVGLENAVPLTGEDTGGFGFSLEGNPFAYMLIVSILIVVCFIAYRRLKC